MSKKENFESLCNILAFDVPCILISGSGGNFKLVPDAFNGERIFTLTLPDDYMVRLGDEIRCGGRSYVVRATMKSEDNTKLYWAILTRYNKQNDV